jgi:hypothetical protein
LLPIEQLLSGTGPLTTERKAAPEPKKSSDPPAAARPFVSPFAADSARKGTPRMEAATGEGPVPVPRPAATASGPQVVMGSAAPAAAFERRPEPVATVPTAGVEEVRGAVLNALTNAGLAMLSSMLESGEWKSEGNEVIVRVAASASLIEMSVSNEGRKIAIAAASGTLGRPVKLQVLPGGTPQVVTPRSASRPSNGSSRSRAEQEPVIQRLREKFGAEIRTVIDYKQKK